MIIKCTFMVVCNILNIGTIKMFFLEVVKLEMSCRTTYRLSKTNILLVVEESASD